MPITADLPGRGAALAPHFAAELARLGFDAGTQTLGLAVSGGGDSIAMLHLAHQAGIKAQVATVDHGLRPASADEALMVAHVAQTLGYRHTTLIWQGWDGRGNVQDRARRARRDLLATWAHECAMDMVALAHTQGDLAEGFIMRLARGAGVDGLAAMPARFVHNGAAFLRPLLWAARQDLRDFCVDHGAAWVDDPSNTAEKFDRVRARKALPDLAKLGLTSPVLANVAQHLRQASQALDHAVDDLARACLHQASGIITLAPSWQLAPPELQRRLLQRVIMWIAPADYPPRGAALGEVILRLSQSLPAQLAGCHFLPHQGRLVALREAKRCAQPVAVGQLWDGTWHYRGQISDLEAKIGPLGAAGLLQWQGWRAAGLPRAALLSQPAVWLNGQLVATPMQPQLGQNHAFLRSPAADSLYLK